MSHSDSVLTTQEPVLKLDRKIRQTEERVARLKARLAKAVDAHREQLGQTTQGRINGTNMNPSPTL